MAVKFKLQKSGMKSRNHYGMYYAHTIRGAELTLEQIEERIQANCSAKVSDVRMVMAELFSTIRLALSEGQVVNLGDLGKLYLSVTSKPVERPQDFRVDKHITGIKCKYIHCGHRMQQEGMKGNIKRLLTQGCKAVHDRKATQRSLGILPIIHHPQ